jgi:hypothetical protein
MNPTVGVLPPSSELGKSASDNLAELQEIQGFNATAHISNIAPAATSPFRTKYPFEPRQCLVVRSKRTAATGA